MSLGSRIGIRLLNVENAFEARHFEERSELPPANNAKTATGLFQSPFLFEEKADTGAIHMLDAPQVNSYAARVSPQFCVQAIRVSAIHVAGGGHHRFAGFHPRSDT
jgi:hypothetical protein